MTDGFTAPETILFRPAEPGDGEAAVPLIYESGPDAFDYVFAASGTDARGFLRSAFADGAGEFGFRTHWVGMAAGAVAVVGAGFSGRQSLSFTLAAARQIIRHYGPARAAGVIRRGLAVEAVIRPPRRGEFCLGHIAVRPDLRGHGLGRAMVEHLLAVGRSEGFARSCLDVADGNSRARRLYQSLGFEVTALRHSRLASARGRVADHFRMERRLGALLAVIALLWSGMAHPAAAADPAHGRALFATCAACHGANGAGDPGTGAPDIAGQDSAYLLRQLDSFAAGRRGSSDDFAARMREIAASLGSEADRADLAAYAASLKPVRTRAKAETQSDADFGVGRNYYNGICSACHGSDGKGNALLGAPRLLGQDPAYLSRQYAAFKEGRRGAGEGDKYGAQMRRMTRALPDAATERAVLGYVASLGGGG